jgi:hypothetical protein
MFIYWFIKDVKIEKYLMSKMVDPRIFTLLISTLFILAHSAPSYKSCHQLITVDNCVYEFLHVLTPFIKTAQSQLNKTVDMHPPYLMIY